MGKKMQKYFLYRCKNPQQNASQSNPATYKSIIYHDQVEFIWNAKLVYLPKNNHNNIKLTEKQEKKNDYLQRQRKSIWQNPTLPW